MNNDLLTDLLGRFTPVNDNANTDITEYNDRYEADVVLPGFKKDGIHLKYDVDTLYIHAVHEINKVDTDEKGTIVNREINSSNIDRSFYIPGIDPNQITAEYNGGILKIVLPKAAKDDSNSNEIKIN